MTSVATSEPTGSLVTHDVTTVAPHVRSHLNVRRVLHRAALATIPCLLFALYNTGRQIYLVSADAPHTGWRADLARSMGLGASPSSIVDCAALGLLYVAPLLVAVAGACGLTEWCFAKARGRPRNGSALPLVSLLFLLALPAGIPVWQAAFAAAAGVAFGKEIFGGTGRGFVHPVVVGLVVLYFAYPASLSGNAAWVPGAPVAAPLAVATQSGIEGLRADGSTWRALALGAAPGALGAASPLAVVLGAAMLVGFRVASWRILVGGVAGLWLGVAALQGLGIEQPIATVPPGWHLVLGSFAFGLVFLATDPTSSVTTNAGRWVYGVWVGAAVAVIRLANPAHEDGTILALLLASVTAPLLDWVVARAQYRIGRVWRERRG